ISTRVRARFAAYPGLLPPNRISIQTLDQVVYLSGLVSTETDRVLAATVAAQVDGVTRVVNNVAVTYSGH
ncbi:MAG: BON domain-containing protein, partial [Sinobacteraceae bacterium]|nr:BON domain-containing protein [Nevskiaceae bacterium]